MSIKLPSDEAATNGSALPQTNTEFPPDPMHHAGVAATNFLIGINEWLAKTPTDTVDLARLAMNFDVDMYLIAEGRVPDDNKDVPFKGTSIGNDTGDPTADPLIAVVNKLISAAKDILKVTGLVSVDHFRQYMFYRKTLRQIVEGL